LNAWNCFIPENTRGAVRHHPIRLRRFDIPNGLTILEDATQIVNGPSDARREVVKVF